MAVIFDSEVSKAIMIKELTGPMEQTIQHEMRREVSTHLGERERERDQECSAPLSLIWDRRGGETETLLEKKKESLISDI